MSKLLGADGKPVNADPSQKINRLITAVEGAARMGDSNMLGVISELLRGGWEIGHDPSLPAMKCMAVTINQFQRDVNGNLQMASRGIVSLGDHYLSTIEKIKELNEQEVAQAQEEAKEAPLN